MRSLFLENDCMLLLQNFYHAFIIFLMKNLNSIKNFSLFQFNVIVSVRSDMRFFEPSKKVINYLLRKFIRTAMNMHFNTSSFKI